MTQNTAKDQTQREAPAAGADPDIVVGPEDMLNYDRPGADASAPGADAGASDGTADSGEAAPADPAARIAELEAEVARLKRDHLNALAEAENAKRRADKRIQDNTKYAVANLAKAILPVADNMERALAAAPEQARVLDPHLKNLAVGVEMTAKELMNALAQYGVQRIEAQGQPFDPNLHQAMQEMENPDVPAGTVVQVYQEGYVIHDRLLRPSMVVVSKGGPKRTAQTPPPGGDAGTSGSTGGGGGGRVDTSA
ncbi:nucleotide exchange factor GrpE [Roseospira goensis]|uniref:Protein GrpE n=1 Tax=Roseospira goensis TaxID=391922 RepID=A0A7W6S096_9PROT|nr:nucleotide exchange factor GrpE [Roseospira goensis]MBB4286473.1 molecular chaperone GrpE [Roseospira goensis]